MYKHMLVPLDGTPQAEEAVAVAAGLASRSGGRVTLLHVIESAAPGEVHGERHLTSSEEAVPYLKRVAAEMFPKAVEVGLHVHEEKIDNVAGSVADHVWELAPDLVVMCAHGEPRLRDRLFGNLAQQTLAQGGTPVLLIKGCPPGEGFRRVLVPLDGNPEHDERGLPVAAGMAGLYGAGLRLLYVVPSGAVLTGRKTDVSLLLPGTSRAILDLEQEEAVSYLERRLKEVIKEGQEVKGVIVRGEPVEEIAGYARSENADLVVLATHGKAGARAFWSASVASRLTSRLEVTLLLVPARLGKTP